MTGNIFKMIRKIKKWSRLPLPTVNIVKNSVKKGTIEVEKQNVTRGGEILFLEKGVGRNITFGPLHPTWIRILTLDSEGICSTMCRTGSTSDEQYFGMSDRSGSRSDSTTLPRCIEWPWM
jgi:hypothetical protein